MSEWTRVDTDQYVAFWAVCCGLGCRVYALASGYWGADVPGMPLRVPFPDKECAFAAAEALAPISAKQTQCHPSSPPPTS